MRVQLQRIDAAHTDLVKTVLPDVLFPQGMEVGQQIVRLMTDRIMVFAIPPGTT
jgi:hypothetical protein